MLQKLQISKKLLRQLDYGMLFICVLIVVFGIMNILSTTRINLSTPDIWNTTAIKKQILWLVISLIVTYVILLFDYSFFMHYAPVFYWLGVFLLILNWIKPTNVNGADSWLSLGPISFQPSEFAKIGLILMLSKKIEDMEGKINNLKNLSILAIYALIPVAIIVRQPDMGMTMVCFFIVLCIMFVAGLDWRIILGGLWVLALAIVLVWNSGMIKPYQKDRIASFVNPEADQLGAGLQLNQSLIAIGSGGPLGKGFLKGNRASGGFVPEANTDFIFASVGEEWGFVGSLGLMTLYGLLIYKFIKIARSSKDIFGTMVTSGMIGLYLFSILQNMGMAVGIMPITGITLPLMSYGGTSLLSSFIGIALVLSIGMRRKKINF